MITKPELTQERLRELLDYRPETGVFTWRGKAKVGIPVGRIQTDGYSQIRVDGKLYLAHRLAWLYVHGEWPTSEIDHIDRDRVNNRIANLRDVDRAINATNRRAFGSSGFKGVTSMKKGSRFFARISRIDGSVSYLGVFDSAEAAHEAYKAAHVEQHGIESEFFDELHEPHPALVEFAAEVINRARAQRDTAEEV